MTDPRPRSPKPRCEREDALAVLKRLREAGHVAYFAGGCVRDELMGLSPKDYDIATDAPPARVQELFSRTQAVGVAFGVILVRHRQSVVEVATFRKDVSYEDGRRPTQVVFTDAQTDARRRDFTINGLFLDPIENQIIDYVQGQQDLRDKVLRAIGNAGERFEEDHLRLLRAVRFAARFDLTIETTTAQAIAKHAPALRRISQERIADELRAMLTPATRSIAWPMLWGFGLIQVVMRMMPEGERAPREIDEARSILLALAPGETISFSVALAAAAICYRWQANRLSIDPRVYLQESELRRTASAMRQALKTSNEELDGMIGVLSGIAPLLRSQEPSVAQMKRFLAEPTSRESRRLMTAMSSVDLHRPRIAWLQARLSDLEQAEFAPPPLLTGDDLVACGLKPGPAFKGALDFVYDEQLEGRIMNRQQALEVGEAKVRELESRGSAR